MLLRHVQIERFQNFMNRQTVTIEPDVTCLVGKNESGKTTILRALHRLNPANGTSKRFNLTVEYPMARLARDRKASDLSQVRPVQATFDLDDSDIRNLQEAGLSVPETGQVKLVAARTYGNDLLLELHADFSDLLAEAATVAGVHDDDLSVLKEADSPADLGDRAKVLAKELKDGNQAARSRAVASLAGSLSKISGDLGGVTGSEQFAAVKALLPKFFYFSDYANLPGTVDLHELAEMIKAGEALDARQETVVALLDYAGEEPADFLDEEYVSRKAELQAASRDLTNKVFEYWKQNTELAVVLNTDMPVVKTDAQGREVRHRTLHIELRDDRHGGVETNFSTRSSGFQWFFSFLAAFSKYQDSNEPIIVLLDEPGTSLHGEAQGDFLRYINGELGMSKQVLYTTHSQHMIDPTRYEKLRAVHDRATRDNHTAGVAVTTVDLSADRDTVLPVEAALGYSVAQHLFIGSGHHLIVEGSSDFIYLQRLSDHLLTKGRISLDPRFAILPVGSVENVPPFVALLGRRLPMTVLIDGAQSSRQHQRVKAAAAANGMDVESIVLCSTTSPELPGTADIEDLFDIEDYLWLYSKTFSAMNVEELAKTKEPVLRRIQSVRGEDFDHALPAHTLTGVRDEFFAQVRPETLDRFEALIKRLNETLPSPVS